MSVAEMKTALKDDEEEQARRPPAAAPSADKRAR
jgi:hypothetical protein